MSTPARRERLTSVETVLVVDTDALRRMPLCQYLRDCGYRVFEAASADEAVKPNMQVDVILSDIDLSGTANGFAFAILARLARPGVEVVLVGSPKRAVDAAAKLCDQGPTLMKPYDHQLVLAHIKRLLAARGSGMEANVAGKP